MIKFSRIPLDKIDIPLNALNQYLETRPDVLKNTDIFIENCRSKGQEFKNFSLFEETSGADTVVFPVYLELFEYLGIPVLDTVRKWSEYVYPKIIVFQWNHDKDFADYPESAEIRNARFINFNTSSKKWNDILVPFWTINTKYYTEPHVYYASMFCSMNTQLRINLREKINNRGYTVKSGLPYEEFLKEMSRSRFSLCPRGSGLSSYRFYECFHLHTVPVLMADTAILPFSEIDYSDICVCISENSSFDEIDYALKKAPWQTMLDNAFKIRYKFSLLGVQQEIHNRLISI